MGELTNGIPARVRVLESEMKTTQRDLNELKRSNTKELEKIRQSLSRVMLIGVGILVTVIGALIDRVVTGGP